MDKDSPDNLTLTGAPGPRTQASAHEYMNVIMAVIYSVVFLVGMVGNGLVIYVTGFRMKRSVNSVWFLNLAVADFLFTSFLIFLIISVAQGYHWPFGNLMCKLKAVVVVGNMFASIFFLTAISLDRCLCTWVVVWAQNHRTILRAQVTCAGIWLAALACSIPYVLCAQFVEKSNSTYCIAAEGDHKHALTHFRFTVGFLIPMLVITGSYTAIGLRMRHFKRTRSRKSLRIIISIILAFAVCWIPFHVSKYIQLYYPTNPFRRFSGPISLSLVTVNSCLNPLLYVFMCEQFLVKLRKSLFHVLENALAEDYLSSASSHSKSNLSRIFRRSESGTDEKRKDTSASLTETFTQVPNSEED